MHFENYINKLYKEMHIIYCNEIILNVYWMFKQSKYENEIARY